MLPTNDPTCNLKSYKTIVLSGSNTNGCITLGAVQYLYMKGSLDNLVNFIGCSSGSIICAVLSVGLSPLEGLEYICNGDTFRSFGKLDVNTFLAEGKGLLSFEGIKSTLATIYKERLGYIPTLEQLYRQHNKNMIISTVNFSKAKQVYLKWETHPTLLVTDAIQMSCSFPLIYKPFEYEGDLYIDGGVGDNFPIRLVKDPEDGIGICVLEKPKADAKDDTEVGILTTLKTLHRVYLTHKNITVRMYLEGNLEANKGTWIYLDKVDSSFFDFTKTRFKLAQMFILGYDRMATEMTEKIP